MTTCERFIIGDGYKLVSHFQEPWWAGFNEAQRNENYYNNYSTLTSKYEYQQGYLTGSVKRTP